MDSQEELPYSISPVRKPDVQLAAQEALRSDIRHEEHGVPKHEHIQAKHNSAPQKSLLEKSTKHYNLSS